MSTATSATAAGPAAAASPARPRAAASVEPATAEAAAPTPRPRAADVPPLRKAAILLVSLDETLSRPLLAQLDRAAVDAVSLEMGRLERIDPAEQATVLDEFCAQALRRLRFTFEDVARMDGADLRRAYHDDDAVTWARALAGAARPVRHKVLGALAGPAAEQLRRALVAAGPTRLDDVESAQAELVERLRRLHDEGLVALPDPSGQEEILV